jgi:hypothetical protein
MKTKLASVLGLAVFVASFICGGSLVYAETEETSSAMQIIATVADANGAESELSCVFDSAGADICPVIAKLEDVDEPLAAAPAVEAVDAIVVEVSQSVTVAAPGQEAGDVEEPAHTGSISEPSVGEPVVMRDSPKD